jgi:DNA topoisomerase I
MAKALLIVESPTKAKTLGRYLGKDFIVKASVGHVKDLPKNKLGIDLGKGFAPEYQVIRGKKKIITELNAAAAQVDAVYLGPDPDREGEAIAWHIAEEIKGKDKPIYRVLFYELTHKAIEAALARPQPLNHGLFEAQQARRILDRLVGYLISPILWLKVKRGLSAGRVQSVALRLICEREDVIRAFTAEEYWTIDAELRKTDGQKPEDAAGNFVAGLWRVRNKKCQITSEVDATVLVEALRKETCSVAKVERKKKKRHPAPPFVTSTLQQEAARKLRFSARQTMSVAQRLYEGMEVGDEGAVGLITYMRTDSTRLSSDALTAAREFIGRTWGAEVVPAKPNFYKTKASAQDAHEAIRPTDVNRTPEAVAPFISREQLKLYTLIWKRFVACQMVSAIIAQTSVDVQAGEYTLRATGSVIESPGFMAVYVESVEDGEGNGAQVEGWLPDLAQGDSLDLLSVTPKQHFTQPPPRFSEASLIKELEERGIGRPSTYATILSTIMDREYVTIGKQRLHPTELGWLINALLVQSFPNIVDVEFTANMEKGLDEIENGKQAYLALLNDFYTGFAGSVQSAESQMLNMKAVGWPTDVACPTCGKPLHIRMSRNGTFMACSGYPACTFTSDYKRDEHGVIELVSESKTGEVCEKCGRDMVIKKGRFGTFLACSGYPECRNTRAQGTGASCPREGCSGELVERVGKRGRRFYGCNKYPECSTVFWDRPVMKPCPSCGAPFLLEKHMKGGGVKLVCAKPKCGYSEKEQLQEEPGEAGGTR